MAAVKTVRACLIALVAAAPLGGCSLVADELLPLFRAQPPDDGPQILIRPSRPAAAQTPAG